MKNIIPLIVAVFIVIANGIIGHYFAPNGITLTPVVLTIITYIICFRLKSSKVVLISLLTYIFVALNDFSIKLYSGGTTDYEGLEWIHLFLLIGLIPTLVILSFAIFKKGKEKLSTKILSLILFIVLMIIHFQLFSLIGLDK